MELKTQIGGFIMSEHVIVTIARQYGSSGHAIGKKIAEEFNMAYHDKSLIEEAAKRSGISEEALKNADERATPSFLYSIAMGNYDVYPLSVNFAPYEMPVNDKLFSLQCDIIREEAEKGPCVFVGRCADYILNGREKLVKIFIYADIDERARRVAEHHKISVQDARTLIYKTDKRRANYYNYYTSLKWGKSDNYNLMVDTTKIGVDGAVKLISEYIRMLQC